MPDSTNIERFLPFHPSELIEALCQENFLDERGRALFREFSGKLASLYHHEFHHRLEELKRCYAPFDPDSDKRPLRSAPQAAELRTLRSRLILELGEVLRGANYEEIPADAVLRAMAESAIFDISLKVDLDEFEHLLLYQRGASVKTVLRNDWLGRPRSVSVPVYERVALLAKLREPPAGAGPSAPPSGILLKLFRDIPRADLEMLFPNTRIGMTLKNKLMLAVPGVAGGVGLLIKSGGAVLAAFGVVALLVRSLLHGGPVEYPGSAEMAAIVASLIALGSLGAYVVRQWMSYRSRKIAFLKTLMENLYYRNLDNNAGVLHHLLDAAEEEECKEAFLAYYFLLAAPEGLGERELDERVEAWLARVGGVRVDFEIGDALRKLRRLGLCREEAGGRLAALPIEEGLRRLQELWSGALAGARLAE